MAVADVFLLLLINSHGKREKKHCEMVSKQTRTGIRNTPGTRTGSQIDWKMGSYLVGISLDSISLSYGALTKWIQELND